MKLINPLTQGFELQNHYIFLLVYKIIIIIIITNIIVYFNIIIIFMINHCLLIYNTIIIIIQIIILNLIGLGIIIIFLMQYWKFQTNIKNIVYTIQIEQVAFIFYNKKLEEFTVLN